MREHGTLVGKRIRELRESRNIKISDLSATLGIDRTTLTKYELGSRCPNVLMLVNIASYFGVSVDYLTGHTHEYVTFALDDVLRFCPTVTLDGYYLDKTERTAALAAVRSRLPIKKEDDT